MKSSVFYGLLLRNGMLTVQNLKSHVVSRRKSVQFGLEISLHATWSAKSKPENLHIHNCLPPRKTVQKQTNQSNGSKINFDIPETQPFCVFRKCWNQVVWHPASQVSEWNQPSWQNPPLLIFENWTPASIQKSPHTSQLSVCSWPVSLFTPSALIPWIPKLFFPVSISICCHFVSQGTWLCMHFVCSARFR